MSDDNGITKPATEAVKALAGTPMLLTLVILNVLVLGMITYLAKGRADMIVAERKEILEALHNCINQR